MSIDARFLSSGSLLSDPIQGLTLYGDEFGVVDSSVGGRVGGRVVVVASVRGEMSRETSA